MVTTDDLSVAGVDQLPEPGSAESNIGKFVAMTISSPHALLHVLNIIRKFARTMFPSGYLTCTCV